MPGDAASGLGDTPVCRRVRGLLPALLLTTPLLAAAQDTLSLSCVVCHGTPAEPSRVPALHGRSADEIETSLRGYRSGERSGTAMPRLAQSLSDTEIRALAQAFGTNTR